MISLQPQSCPMRMTCNRFVPTLGVPNSSSLRLLPSEHVIILLPSESTCSLENRYVCACVPVLCVCVCVVLCACVPVLCVLCCVLCCVCVCACVYYAVVIG